VFPNVLSDIIVKTGIVTVFLSVAFENLCAFLNIYFPGATQKRCPLLQPFMNGIMPIKI
jgi:hypothetical protein